MNQNIKSAAFALLGIYAVALVGFKIFKSDEAKISAPEIFINMDDFVDALIGGADDNGNTKESYVLKLKEGAVVKFTNAFVTAKNTNSSGEWGVAFSSKVFNTGMFGARVGIPDFNPVICFLDSESEKSNFASRSFDINSPAITVTGAVREFNQNGLLLDDCIIS